MADEIRQELGFDASRALQTLQDLDKVMGNFENRLGQSVKAMGAFNKKGGATVSLLKKLATEGTKAAAALSKVAALSGQVQGAPGTPGVGGASIVPVPGVDQYIKQLESMYKVSDRATEARKRAFQSAITSAAEFAAKNKVSIAQVVSQSQNLDKNFTGLANNMANKLARIEQASKKHLNAAGQATRALTVDFQTMVRIVATQAIVRALSSLRNVLRGAVSDAVEFQTKVAEIGTIAPTDDLGLLGDRVRAISDAFNTPLDQTAKGYYQTISNQIGSTVDEFDTFVKAAAKFSKTSVTDLASAVDLGSGTLNAFGKTAADAEDTFAKFFVTIKQGRVIGSELAQGYGTVAPLADKLGISMEELNAALATVTIQGISADKAFTQLRGVFTSFLKPTPEMSRALKELGFATGEEILQAYDLQTALRLVVSRTDGTAEGIAKLIPRVRGLTGGLALLDDKTGHFNETMEAQGKALQEVYDKGYKLVVETDAQQVTKELNDLTNFMTTEFGEGVLEAAGKMLVFVGGSEQIERVLAAIGPQLPKVALGITAVGSTLGVMAVKARLASAGLTGLVGPLGALAAIPAAMALGDYIGQSIVDSFDAEYQAFKDAMDKQLEARNKKVDAEISLEKQKVSELTSLLARALAESRSQYLAVADSAVDSNKRILDDIKYFSDGVIREASRAAREAQNQVENLAHNALASEERVGKLRVQLDDKIFANRIKHQDDVNKVYALSDRAAELASRAANRLSEAKTEDQRASADEEFRRAQAFAEQALSIAEGTDNAGLEAKALGVIESVTRKNIRAEEDYQKTLQQSAHENVRRAQAEERRVAELSKKQEELIKAYTLYDEETGELLSGDQRQEKLKDAQKKLVEFIQLASRGRPLDVGQMMNFANVSQQIAREMDQFRINHLVASDTALQNLSVQVQKALDRQYEVNIAARNLRDLSGVDLTGPEAERQALAKLTEDYNRLLETKGKYVKANNDVKTATRTLAGAIQEVQSTTDGFGTFLSVVGAKLDEALLGRSQDVQVFERMRDVLQLVDRAAKGGTVTMEELRSKVDALAKAEDSQSFGSSLFSGNFKTDVANAVLALGRLIEAQQNLEAVQKQAPDQRSYDQVLQRLQQLERAREALDKPKQDAQAMNTAVSGASTAMSNAVNPASQLAGHWRSIAASAQLAATASLNVKAPAMAAKGGMIRYLASGGFARGTDRIPAMLTKDEFVVNAKSARQFYSQLTAMNAGVRPVYRESGGTVTNIGDVSINVTESQSSKQTAREVMSAFRREMRRGSGRL